MFFWKKSWTIQNTWNILETNTSKKTFRPETTLPPFFWCSYSECVIIAFYSCSKQKHTGKNRNKYRTHIPKRPCRLETTLPALVLVPIHDLLTLHFVLVQANTNSRKYRKIPETHSQTYTANRTLYARNHPPVKNAGGWFLAVEFETSGGRVVSSLRVFLNKNMLKYFRKLLFHENKACLFYCFGSVYILAVEFETS